MLNSLAAIRNIANEEIEKIKNEKHYNFEKDRNSR